MTDEQKRIVCELKKYAGTYADEYYCGRMIDGTDICMEQGADLIRQMADKIDFLAAKAALVDAAIDAGRVVKAENERIRQNSVSHEAYQDLLDELENVKRERDVACRIIGGEVRTKCGACAHWVQAPSTNGYINKCGLFEIHDVVMLACDVCKNWENRELTDNNNGKVEE